MPQRPNKLAQFWQELKRRRVVHMITVYASASFVLIELVNNLSEPLNLPPKLATIILIILALGFPLAIILAWIYDLTPEGIEKTKAANDTDEDESARVPNAWRIATYVSFVVIVVLITLNIVGGSKALHAGDIQSLVILPFDNFTGDDQLDYFVSGMHASLIGDVGKVGGLKVKSRTSSNAFRDMDMTIPEIASKLGADAALETAVMCLGDTICLQFRLVSTTGDEEQLWVADYREEKSQILNLYHRITKQIAEEVMIELSGDEQRRLDKLRTVNKKAYDDFLRSYAYWGDLSKESLDKADEYLTRAIQKDPEWAPLYAGMAQIWVGRNQMGQVSPEIAIPLIHGYLSRAIELDPDFADSHFISGIIAIWTDWNWEMGEKEFLKALAINPNDVMSRIYYAHLLMILQRSDEAQAQGLLAVDLDPMNPLILALYAIVLTDAGDYQGSYNYAKKALEIDPENNFAFGALRGAAYLIGDYETAFEIAKTQLPLRKDIIFSLDSIFRVDGRMAAYEEMARQLDLFSQEHYFSPMQLARRYLYINDLDRALDYLEKAYELHDPSMPYVGTEITRAESLYNHPRYLALLKKMNLPTPED